MGLLNTFFKSKEALAKEIKEDDDSIIKYWKHYLSTISRKKEIITQLNLDHISIDDLRELKRLLVLDLVDVSDEEKKESELIADLDIIEHSQKIKKIHKLEQCLDYAKTKYDYLYELLYKLHSILILQLEILTKLQLETKNMEQLLSHLKSQFELEITILNKIEKIESFQELFLALIKGEHIIKTMDSTEKIMLEKMKIGVGQIFSNELTQGITCDWAMTVFDAIEDKVREGISNGMFLGYHQDIDFEFVNRPEFVDLARDSISHLKKGTVSEQMITVFVHLFREWYNHERD